MLLRILNPFAIAAGGIWENAGSGTFFKLISATSPINVELWQRGSLVGELKGLTQGMGGCVRDRKGELVDFDASKITSAVAQNITVAVGYGEIHLDALTGTFNALIVNGAAAAAVNIQDGGNSITVDDGGIALKIQDGGNSITVDATPPNAGTSNYYYLGADATLKTVVLPASNTAGVIITAAGAFALLSNSRSRVMFKTSAPSGVHDTAAGTLAFGVQEPASPGIFVGLPIILPPGVGLYAQKDDSTGGGFFVDYKVL